MHKIFVVFDREFSKIGYRPHASFRNIVRDNFIAPERTKVMGGINNRQEVFLGNVFIPGIRRREQIPTRFNTMV